MEELNQNTEYEMWPEEEEALAKDRFMATSDTSQVVLTPQCVSCVHNQGLFQCDVFVKKPEQYMSNLKDCPERE